MYSVAYKVGDEHDSVTVEAPDELTALFRAGYMAGLKGVHVEEARVVLFASSGSPRL